MMGPFYPAWPRRNRDARLILGYLSPFLTFIGQAFTHMVRCAAVGTHEALPASTNGEPVRRPLLTALVTGLIILSAPAAHAATRDVSDASSDVMTATMSNDSDTITYNREGGAEGDIVFARVQHTATQVVMYLRYRQLTVPRQYAGFQFVVEGNNHKAAMVAIMTRHAKPQGQGFARGAHGACKLSYRVNYANDSISARIPRTCVGRAKYVRLVHLSYRYRLSDAAMKIYYDSPARNGGTLNQVQAAATPWVVTG